MLSKKWDLYFSIEANNEGYNSCQCNAVKEMGSTYISALQPSLKDKNLSIEMLSKKLDLYFSIVTNTKKYKS